MINTTVLGLILMNISFAGFAWLGFDRAIKWKKTAKTEQELRYCAEDCMLTLTKRLTAASIDTIETMQELDKLTEDYNEQQKKLVNLTELLDRAEGKGGETDAARAV